LTDVDVRARGRGDADAEPSGARSAEAPNARRRRRARRWGAVLVAAGLAAGCGDAPPQHVVVTGEPTSAPTTDANPHEHAGAPRLVERLRTPEGRYEDRLVIGGETATEVSDFPPGSEPTDAQRAAADELRREVRAALAAWPDLDAALAAGFEPYPHLGRSHVVHLGNVADGRVLDPEHPEFLLVDDNGVVHGAMFLAADNTAAGPQPGGPLTVWHYHTYPAPACWRPGGLLPAVDPLADQSACPEDALISERSPEMLHVWLLEHPQGPFSSDMSVFETVGSSSTLGP
jgi:hypothetical protein